MLRNAIVFRRADVRYRLYTDGYRDLGCNNGTEVCKAKQKVKRLQERQKKVILL